MSRLGYLVITCFLAEAAIIFSLIPHTPRLLWNESASVRIGLYSLRPASDLRVGDLVVDKPSAGLSRYMASRRYLPADASLLKYVAAVSGQNVCRRGMIVSIDGQAIATALAKDRANRPLPVWQGCHTLKPSEIFLLSPAIADSFDGRYFGAVPLDTVTARAKPIWTEIK
jgi:conjugative transfer signal peptidase TraF